MTQRALFFDSEAGDRVYTSEAWAQIFGRFISEGYVAEFADGLRVVATDPASMDVRVRLGAMWLGGDDVRMFEVHGAPELLSLAASDPSNSRIDRVVVTLDLNARDAFLEVLTGTPASSPSPPALTRTATVYQMSLAQILVGATVTSVSDSNITDERNDDAVCGRMAIPVSEPTGAMKMWPAAAAPDGYMLCQGQAISRTEFADLFDVIGTAYGAGDGATTFNIPDLRQRFPLGKADAGTGSALGDSGGVIDHTHASAAHRHNIPNHSTQSENQPVEIINNGTGGTINAAAPNHTHNFGDGMATSFETPDPTGPNNPPFVALNFIVKT